MRENIQPSFEGFASDKELIEKARAYAESVVEKYDLDIDLSLIHWEVSHQAKRSAGSVKSPQIKGAKVGVPIDWEKSTERMDAAGHTPTDFDSRFASYRECRLRLTWGAFEKFDDDECRNTLKHELIHVDQFQQYGRTDHGYEFKRIAQEIGASLSCPKFSEAEYILYCRECDGIVAERYRRSKTVKHPERYRSKCCNAPLEVEGQ